MPETIDQEVKQLIRSPFDFSKQSEIHKTTTGLYTFQSPSIYTIDKHYYYLLRNAKEVEFQKQYRYKPDYLSYDEYGTVVLDKLLMYVNNVAVPEDFDLVTVVIPLREAIIDILPDNFPEKEVADMTEINW